jgi:hypothetical protein
MLDSSNGRLNRDCQDVVFQQTPSEAAFEVVARDAPVAPDGRREPLTNSRLGHGLQRLFQPIGDDPHYRLDHLLLLLDRASQGFSSASDRDFAADAPAQPPKSST